MTLPQIFLWVSWNCFFTPLAKFTITPYNVIPQGGCNQMCKMFTPNTRAISISRVEIVHRVCVMFQQKDNIGKCHWTVFTIDVPDISHNTSLLFFVGVFLVSWTDSTSPLSG